MEEIKKLVKPYFAKGQTEVEITAVLKYIDIKIPITEIDIEFGAKYSMGLSNNKNNILIDITKVNGEYIGIVLPNKPLHLYNNQEEKELLELLLKLK